MPETKRTCIYACNGVSGAGRLTNTAAFELQERGVGAVSCLSGIGAGIPAKISSAKGAGRIVVLDGCGLRCACRILENAGIGSYESFVVPDSGVKVSGEKPTGGETKKFADYVAKSMG